MANGINNEGDNDDCVELLENDNGQEKNTIATSSVGKLWIDKNFNVRTFMNTIRDV